MPDLLLLDGELVDVAAARISPLDRGFLFGDGVYEVVRVAEGVPLFLDRHLARLARSLAAVSIAEPAGIEAGCRTLLAAGGLRDGSLYLQVTRGAGPRTHLPAPTLRPTWLVMPGAQKPLAPGAQPLRAVILADPRWQRCDIKTTSLMGTVLGKLAARDAAADEVIFVAADGALREGGSTSLCVRQDDVLLTHPLDGRILPSITRERVLATARRLGLPVEERAPRLDERARLQEALLCGTLTGVQPLVELDGQSLPAGEWTARLGGALESEQASAVAAGLAAAASA
jgi:D-alanine transaminase